MMRNQCPGERLGERRILRFGPACLRLDDGAYPGCMCGRYTNTAGIDEINDHLGVPLKDDVGTRRFNVAPTEEVLALVAPNGEVEPRLLRWGLVPSWRTDLKGASRLINARMEWVTSSPVYRGLIGKGSRRALQVADGYFEWLKAERRGELRQPFFFQVDSGVPFAFASLWTLAKVDGEWVQSVSFADVRCLPESCGAGYPRSDAGDPCRSCRTGRVVELCA